MPAYTIHSPLQLRNVWKQNTMKKEMDKAVLVLQNILERGTEGGEFACFDPKNEAKDMMYAIEGMKVVSLTTGISEKKVDSEFLHMMERIVIEDEE